VKQRRVLALLRDTRSTVSTCTTSRCTAMSTPRDYTIPTETRGEVETGRRVCIGGHVRDPKILPSLSDTGSSKMFFAKYQATYQIAKLKKRKRRDKARRVTCSLYAACRSSRHYRTLITYRILLSRFANNTNVQYQKHSPTSGRSP
jgi:hypothetical protein